MPISSGLNSEIIRVGIVLPQDRIDHITISWDHAHLLDSNLSSLSNKGQLTFISDDRGISVKGHAQIAPQTRYQLSTSDAIETLSTGSGLHLNHVVAGRGFHWEKRITVDLPGQIEITMEDGFLQVINNLDVEAYVACVATSEMGAAAPADLLAAQTVVARCWSMALAESKHLDQGFDVCNDDCCQRYQGTTFLTSYSLQAAIETKGEVLIFDQEIIDARYSKNCGGMVESSETVWGGDHVPYLIPLWDAPSQRPGQGVDDFEDLYRNEESYCATARFKDVDLKAMLGNVDVSGSYYRWQEHLLKQDILENVRKHLGLTWNHLAGVQIQERGPSARICKLRLLAIDEQDRPTEHLLTSEYSIRQVLSPSFLYSSAFVIDNMDTLDKDDHLSLRGLGWGHGVGMCQMGALGMALDNLTYQQILQHYYPGTELVSLPNG